MRQIEVGQTWFSKHAGRKSNSKIKIVKKLNAKCWEIKYLDSDVVDTMNDQQIKEEYAIFRN